MKSYVDHRTLIVKEYETLTMPESLVAVSVFRLPSGKNIELDEVRIQIEKIISKFNFDGYEINDKRTKFECGAGGCGQEIIFAIMISMAGNVAYDILKTIFFWAKNNIYPTAQNAPEDLEGYMENIKNIIDLHFFPSKNLSILEMRKTDMAIKAKLVDDESRYDVELLPNGEIIKIKKINIS